MDLCLLQLFALVIISIMKAECVPMSTNYSFKLLSPSSALIQSSYTTPQMTSAAMSDLTAETARYKGTRTSSETRTSSATVFLQGVPSAFPDSTKLTNKKTEFIVTVHSSTKTSSTTLTSSQSVLVSKLNETITEQINDRTVKGRQSFFKPNSATVSSENVVVFGSLKPAERLSTVTSNSAKPSSTILYKIQTKNHVTTETSHTVMLSIDPASVTHVGLSLLSVTQKSNVNFDSSMFLSKPSSMELRNGGSSSGKILNLAQSTSLQRSKFLSSVSLPLALSSISKLSRITESKFPTESYSKTVLDQPESTKFKNLGASIVSSLIMLTRTMDLKLTTSSITVSDRTDNVRSSVSVSPVVSNLSKRSIPSSLSKIILDRTPVPQKSIASSSLIVSAVAPNASKKSIIPFLSGIILNKTVSLSPEKSSILTLKASSSPFPTPAMSSKMKKSALESSHQPSMSTPLLLSTESPWKQPLNSSIISLNKTGSVATISLLKSPSLTRTIEEHSFYSNHISLSQNILNVSQTRTVDRLSSSSPKLIVSSLATSIPFRRNSKNLTNSYLLASTMASIELSSSTKVTLTAVPTPQTNLTDVIHTLTQHINTTRRTVDITLFSYNITSRHFKYTHLSSITPTIIHTRNSSSSSQNSTTESPYGILSSRMSSSTLNIVGPTDSTSVQGPARTLVASSSIVTRSLVKASIALTSSKRIEEPVSSTQIILPAVLQTLLTNSKASSLRIVVPTPFKENTWNKLVVFVIMDKLGKHSLGTWYSIFVEKRGHDRYPAIIKTPDQAVFNTKRAKRSTKILDIELGTETTCGNNLEVICNGPLAAGTAYRIQLEVYYKNGTIALTPTSQVYRTKLKEPTTIPKSGPSSLIIIILIILLIFFIFLTIVISIIVCRRRRMRGQRQDKDMGVSLMSGSYQKNGNNRTKKKFSGPDILMERRKSLKGMTRPISIRDFRAWVERSSSDSDFRFAEEFESIRDVGKFERHEVADMPENRGKNRYVNVLSYDYTRVKLASIDDEPGSDYINANYIHGYKQPRAYIATQGPLPSTTDDFWRMIWEQNSRLIVMVTQCMERGRVKCHQYWPNTADPTRYGEISVTLVNETIYSEWIEREFLLEFESETRRLRHYQYTAWPDHGVPRSSKEMLQFALTVRFHQKPEDGPLICHCSAGVGRTGTYLCVDILINKLQSENNVDVYGVVCLMRTQRCSMVQTEDQYIFIHRVILDYLKQRDEKHQIFSGYSTLEMRKKSKNEPIEPAMEALLKEDKEEDDKDSKVNDFLSEIDSELESNGIYPASDASS